MEDAGKELFERSRPTIERSLRGLGRRKGLGAWEMSEVRSYVYLKLIDDDYRRLRRHDGSGSLAGYLRVVIDRLYLDYVVSGAGKWHASASAKRHGALAVELERLVFRDGYSPHEAIETLTARARASGLRPQLESVLHRLPVRLSPRLIAEELAPTTPCRRPDPLELLERDGLARALRGALARALAELSGSDRRLLELRYRRSLTVPEIASRLGVAAKPLYARLERLLARVRDGLRRAGLAAELSGEALDRAARSIDLEALFVEVAA